MRQDQVYEICRSIANCFAKSWIARLKRGMPQSLLLLGHRAFGNHYNIPIILKMFF